LANLQHRKIFVWLLLPLYYGVMSYISVRLASFHITNNEFYGVMAAIGVHILGVIWETYQSWLRILLCIVALVLTTVPISLSSMSPFL